jgi:hypothetical protein
MSDVLPYPLINGYEPSFASIEATLAGTGLLLPLPSIKAISYKDSLTSAKIYGNSPFPQGRTRGQLAPAGSIEFYRRQWGAVQTALSGNGLWGISERSWVITVTYAETGFQTIMDVLEGVRIHSPDFSGNEGTEALTVKCDIDIMKIILGGKATSLSQKNIMTIVP